MGLRQFYSADEMRGFNVLTLNQQKRLKVAVEIFHSQFVTMELSKDIDKLSFEELNEECKKRCLRCSSIFKPWMAREELRERLREFINNQYFVAKRNELLIHGYMSKLEQKYKLLNMPICLLQIIVKYHLTD